MQDDDDPFEIVPVVAMASPCINICEMDDDRDLCLGCARTLDEIAGWTAMDPAERDRLMAELPARRAALGLD